MFKRKLKNISFSELVTGIRKINGELTAQAGRAVNISLTLRNWLIGCYISEYELNGKDRASYGERLLSELSKALKNISNCNRRQLYRYLKFYRLYPQIVGTLSPQSADMLPAGVDAENVETLNTYVSWYKQNMMSPGDNPPVGLLLCTGKDRSLAEYALAGMDNRLFVSKYQLQLPRVETMQTFINEQLRQVRPPN